jgi:pimeloyl-ACP methyl ester carboxylesterase
MAKVSGRPETTGRRAASWVGLVLAALLCGIAALLAAGLAYQAIATEVDERRYPPPGEMVDVGGYRMHLNVAGQDERGPTVILDAGSQSASFQWGWVQPEVAKDARVVSYDRPGTGWSDAPPEPLDAGEFAKDLHEALDKAGTKGPYVVVGHSMGSLTARAFAERYSDEVMGAVLVDPRNLSLHEDFPNEFPEASVPADPPVAVRLQAVAARLGVVRVLDPLGSYAERLPARQEGEGRAYVASQKPYSGLWADVRLGENAAAEALRDGEHLDDEPLVVLSAGEPDAMNFPPGDRRGFTAMHGQMARGLSARGEHRVVRGADHLSIVVEREHAGAVADAVQEVIEEAGTG